MNKFEKLIEYIINDEDQKARELFHDIVVEKSRDIYESIMDEEGMDENVHGGQVEDLANEVQDDESAMGEGEGEEFDLDHEEGDEVGGDMPADDGADMGGDMGGEHEEHEEIEDKVMSIDAKLDELLAKFDEIMHDEAGGEEHDMDDMGGDEGGEEHDEEGAMFEAQSGKSGKSGSAMSGKSGKSGSGMMEAAEGSGKSGKSGASGSAKSGKSGKSGSAKSGPELMREYVDRIGDIYGGAGDASEGDAVGAAGKKTSVNTKPGSIGPGADFGGNVVKTDTKSQNQDGTSPTKASNEYTKGEGKLIGKVGNTPGGDKKLNSAGHDYDKQHGGEGKTVGKDGSVPINKKSEIGGKIR
jgi:hypothetical protein